MAAYEWKYVHLRYGIILLKQLRPIVLQGFHAWRDKDKNCYHSDHVSDTLTDAQKERFTQQYNHRSREMYDFHMAKNPEDVFPFQELSFDEIVKNIKAGE